MKDKRIQLLTPLLANQIAAGEVVERPASVIKELIENSIDAGASKIEVEVIAGGKQSLIVRDNGHGINKDDLALAFARHATSKIKHPDDLACIKSMGFRGEALASIAAVARCCLISKTKTQDSGWQVQISPTLDVDIQPAAHPVGTTVRVDDLFYNTPARRKFLRSEKTEWLAIEEVFKRLALAYPGVTFILKNGEKRVKHYPSTEQINEKARCVKIIGSVMHDANQIDQSGVGLSITGWLAPPQAARRQADCQYFYVNQRAVKDRVLLHAVKSLYQQQPSWVEGSHPAFVLYLNIEPEQVDVNVHPTKQEVRFGQSRLVHDFITSAVHKILMKTHIEQSIDSASACHPAPKPIVTPCASKPSRAYPPERKAAPFQAQALTKNYFEQILTKPVEPPTIESSEQGRYWVSQSNQGLTIIDLPRAKKTLYENYFTEHIGQVETQTLLFPQKLTNHHLAEATQSLCTALGFQLKRVENQMMLTAQPYFIKQPLLAEQFECIFKAESQETMISALAESIAWQDIQHMAEQAIKASISLDMPGVVMLTHAKIAELQKEAQLCE